MIIPVRAVERAVHILRVTCFRYLRSDGCRILALLVNHAALESERELRDPRNRGHPRLFEGQSELRDLVAVTSGLRSAHAENPLVDLAVGNADRKLVADIELLLRISSLSDKSCENRSAPFDADHPPADGHAVYALRGLCREQYPALKLA